MTSKHELWTITGGPNDGLQIMYKPYGDVKCAVIGADLYTVRHHDRILLFDRCVLGGLKILLWTFVGGPNHGLKILFQPPGSNKVAPIGADWYTVRHQDRLLLFVFDSATDDAARNKRRQEEYAGERPSELIARIEKDLADARNKRIEEELAGERLSEVVTKWTKIFEKDLEEYKRQNNQ